MLQSYLILASKVLQPLYCKHLHLFTIGNPEIIRILARKALENGTGLTAECKLFMLFPFTFSLGAREFAIFYHCF